MPTASQSLMAMADGEPHFFQRQYHELYDRGPPRRDFEHRVQAVGVRSTNTIRPYEIAEALSLSSPQLRLQAMAPDWQPAIFATSVEAPRLSDVPSLSRL
jgi:hypothetical protein